MEEGREAKNNLDLGSPKSLMATLKNLVTHSWEEQQYSPNTNCPGLALLHSYCCTIINVV